MKYTSYALVHSMHPTLLALLPDESAGGDANGAESLPSCETCAPASRRSGQRDYVAKRDEYLALGVQEYWLIDRFGRTLTAFRKTDAASSPQVVPEDQAYRTDLLPGFELPIGKLQAAADRWET